MENWKQILKEIEESGKSIAQYCRENGLKPYTIRNWKQKLERENGSKGFVGINTQTTSAPIEVIYPNGVRLKLSASYSVKDLKMLLDV
jgi:transposase-like protein